MVGIRPAIDPSPPTAVRSSKRFRFPGRPLRRSRSTCAAGGKPAGGCRSMNCGAPVP